jgi:hypothetical protein
MVTVMKSSQEQVFAEIFFQERRWFAVSGNHVLSLPSRVAGPIFHSKRLLE